MAKAKKNTKQKPAGKITAHFHLTEYDNHAVRINVDANGQQLASMIAGFVESHPESIQCIQAAIAGARSQILSGVLKEVNALIDSAKTIKTAKKSPVKKKR